MRKFIFSIAIVVSILSIIVAKEIPKQKTPLEKYSATPKNVSVLDWTLLKVYIHHKDVQILDYAWGIRSVRIGLAHLYYNQKLNKIHMITRLDMETYEKLSTLKRNKLLLDEIDFVAHQIENYIPEFKKERDFYVKFTDAEQHNVLLAEYIDGELKLYHQ